MKILIITTSHAALGASGEPTGLWLEELTTPYYAFIDAGAEVTIASIAGGPVPVDPRSLKAAGENEASVERYLADEELRRAVLKTPQFSDGLADGYDAIFLPGGHGTMWDYPRCAELAQVIVRFLEAGKVVAAVCHGPAALVGAQKRDGTPLVAGRRIAAFSDSEERAAGLENAVPFLLETRLRSLGARYEAGPDFAPFALRDDNLVTGQNPASASEVARLSLRAIADRQSAEAAE
jgi:putative intracellular protease/amidase